MKQNNKIILITGISRGIGNAVALRFLKEKSTVIGISRTNLKKNNSLYKFSHFLFFKVGIGRRLYVRLFVYSW